MAQRSTYSRIWLAASLASAAACASADSANSPNPMFERWCDEHPCDWEVHGETKKIGTWHPDDFAIELVSDDASVSQLRAELDSARATCLAFSLMAQIDADPHAYLELDFLDDGEVEFSERIPTSDWEVHTFNIAPPTWYEGVRFTVRKAGLGRVVVAEFNVELSKGRCAGTPLPLGNRPTSATCENDEQCASGRCPIRSLADGGTCD